MSKNAEARVKTWNVQKFEATVAQQLEGFQSKLAERQKQIEAFTAGLQKSECRANGGQNCTPTRDGNAGSFS